MDKLVQLQAALRAIETGQRLESVDGVLVRQVLQQPRVQRQSSTPEPDAKDLYHKLLALRKTKIKTNAKQNVQYAAANGESDNSEASRPVQRSSPKKTTTLCRTLTDSAPSLPGRDHMNNNDKTIVEELAASTTHTTENMMQIALIAQGKELQRLEKAVARADVELREELVRAEKLLPSKFLLERNLESGRALEAARNVLICFQHRFYQLYFRHWRVVTLELRRQAQRRAVTEIVRVYRGHRGRREARRLRKELSALAAQQRQLVAFRIKYRSSQALRLQMMWRRFLRNRAIKHRQARQAAASLLQQAFRIRQWRRHSLVTALVNARKLFAAVSLQKLYRGHQTRRKLKETRQRQQQEERVQLALLWTVSKQARAVWMIERRGAGYLIAHRALFPYAMRMRWYRVLDQLKRQRAAKCIARVVCSWFGVETRREVARVDEWLTLVQHEHKRSRSAAVLVQKHLRRWVQQRKFRMVEDRLKKQARRTRLAEKTRRIQQRKGSGSDNNPLTTGISSVVERRTSRVTSSPQRARILSLLKPIPLKKDHLKAPQETDAEAAVIIQGCYRRYRSRKRARFKTWRNQARKVEVRVLQRRAAATEIQRRVRGIQGRKIVRQYRAERLLLRCILRWKWRRSQKRQQAARKLGRWLKSKLTQHLARLWHVEKQRRVAASTRIQQWYRLRYLLPSRVRRILHIIRRRDETFRFCDQSLQVCRQHLADAFVVQSFRASLEDALRPLVSTSQSPTKSKASLTKQKIVTPSANSDKPHSSAVSFPILQMIFLVASGWKLPFVWRELDGKSLFQTKLERAKAVSFFRSLNKRGKPVAHQPPTIDTGHTSQSSTRRNQKPVKGPTGVETFSSVDVDVSVARATSGAKGALNYALFMRVIELLGEVSLAQPTQNTSYWGRFDGADARVLAVTWFALLPHSAMQSLALEFNTFISDQLFHQATRLQRLFTQQHNKLRGTAMLEEMRRILHTQARSRAAVVLQTQARKLLARRELRRRMQETYEKYVDLTWGLPYWLNPRSGYSTWQKPHILGAEDVHCESVPFPPSERMLKAPCHGRKDCDRCAEWVCYDCDEFFCLQCFKEYHKPTPKAGENTTNTSGSDQLIKREHELERLLLCGLCKFQLASRRCLDCIPKTEAKSKLTVKPGSVKLGKKQKRVKSTESDENDDEGHNSESLFCDVCFGFLHRRGGLRTHRTEPLLELCTSCNRDGEDDKSSTSQQPRADLEVFGAAVQYECDVCGDPPHRICGRCALQSHPKESCGELTSVPLQTLGRQQRAKRLREEQEARDRADLDKMRARASRARHERCARKIQTFWHSRAPVHRARQVVAARRKANSVQWLRRQEDARLAKRIAYRTKNALGIASPLSSDTPVERRLRSLHVLARWQLSIRARMFGLLIDEYVTVGIPLPGLGLLHPGSNEIWTSEDLRGWIRSRQTIRIKRLTSQDAQPAERALCAWKQLERWGKAEAEPYKDPETLSAQPEATDSTWLVDVHPKQTITESMVPLALPYDPPVSIKRRRVEEEDAVDDVPVAMFLVEFSLDPKRTVWINHSLAERFWEWKRLKLLARSERAAQRQRTKDYETKQKAQEEKLRLEEDLKRHEDAVDTQDPSASVSAGYDDQSKDYPANYDNGYSLTTLESLDETTAGLVDSGSYYANGNYVDDSNGSSTSNWYGTEYSAYDMSRYSPTVIDDKYNAGGRSHNSTWDSYSAYSSATGYVESQQSVDPNTGWYGAPDYAYNSGDQSDYTQPQEQMQALGSYPSAISNSPYDGYSIDLISTGTEADGYYYPYISSRDDQTSSMSQTTAIAEWEEVYDSATQQMYYVNRLTSETAWQLPAS